MSITSVIASLREDNAKTLEEFREIFKTKIEKVIDRLMKEGIIEIRGLWCGTSIHSPLIAFREEIIRDFNQVEDKTIENLIQSSKEGLLGLEFIETALRISREENRKFLQSIEKMSVDDLVQLCI